MKVLFLSGVSLKHLVLRIYNKLFNFFLFKFLSWLQEVLETDTDWHLSFSWLLRYSAWVDHKQFQSRVTKWMTTMLATKHKTLFQPEVFIHGWNTVANKTFIRYEDWYKGTTYVTMPWKDEKIKFSIKCPKLKMKKESGKVALMLKLLQIPFEFLCNENRFSQFNLTDS